MYFLGYSVSKVPEQELSWFLEGFWAKKTQWQSKVWTITTISFIWELTKRRKYLSLPDIPNKFLRQCIWLKVRITSSKGCINNNMVTTPLLWESRRLTRRSTILYLLSFCGQRHPLNLMVCHLLYNTRRNRILGSALDMLCGYSLMRSASLTITS